MKLSLKYALIPLLPIVLLLYSYSNGSPGRRTGSPGDNNTTCNECHGGNPVQSVQGWITSNIPADGYTPGDFYSITLSALHEGVVKFGFEVTSEDSENIKSGNFNVVDPIRTQIVSLSNGITHTSSGTEPDGNEISWTMEWKAPEQGAGTITIYAAINAANGNNNLSGDFIYNTTFEIDENITTTIDHQKLEELISVYPNPANSYINIALPVSSDYYLFDYSGRIILIKENTTENERLDLNHIKKGIYFIRIRSNGNSFTQKLVKH